MHIEGVPYTLCTLLSRSSESRRRRTSPRSRHSGRQPCPPGRSRPVRGRDHDYIHVSTLRRHGRLRSSSRTRRGNIAEYFRDAVSYSRALLLRATDVAEKARAAVEDLRQTMNVETLKQQSNPAYVGIGESLARSEAAASALKEVQKTSKSIERPSRPNTSSLSWRDASRSPKRHCEAQERRN